MNIEKVKISSNNGNLAAVIHYPEKQTEKLAILCPGYLDSKDYYHLIRLAEALAMQGYTAVRFDPMGTWESGGDISRYTTTQYLEDIRNIIEYMLSKSRYEKILLGGHSRGGQLALLYAARDLRISAVLGIMPSPGHPIIGKDREDWEKAGMNVSQRDLPDNAEQKKEFRVPFSHILDKDKYVAVSEVHNIKCPVVLIAGEFDDMVTPEDVKEIFDNANEPKSFLVIPGIGHNYRHNNEEIVLVNEKILEQLDSMN